MNQYYVYVVELSPKSGETRDQKYDVYVGSSGIPPEERFRKHKTGGKGSRHVRRRGVRLLPQYYRDCNPIETREEAKAIEKRVARSLERRGHRVYGACSSKNNAECWL